MLGNIKFINKKALFESLLEHIEGKKHFAAINHEDFAISFSYIEPPEGYEKTKNPETGEIYPNCCSSHKEMLKDIEDWFNNFPNCCDKHKELLDKEWFKKENYQEAINKIINQHSYTEYMILKRINNVDWFEDITDYLETNFYSFGQLPKGYGSVGMNPYKHYIIELIKYGEIPGMMEEKREKLINYIENHSKKDEPESDLNLLCFVYTEWFKIFPFDLNDYFGHLKEFYSNHLFVLTGDISINRYSGMAKNRLHTKSSLIDFLTDLTDRLIKEINGAVLYEKGLITDVQKTKIDLIINERKLRIKQGYKRNNLDEKEDYIRMLEEWFIDEKKFIDELTPIFIAPKIDNSSNTNKSKNTSEIISKNNDTLKSEVAKENQNFELLINELGNAENKFWKGLPMSVVIEHFKVLTTRKNKNNESYLSKEQFVAFLQKGFLNDTTQLKQKINCSTGEKGFVISRFYDFYDLAVSQYSHPRPKKAFINLFFDCFDNWEESTIESFFKPNKTKEKW